MHLDELVLIIVRFWRRELLPHPQLAVFTNCQPTIEDNSRWQRTNKWAFHYSFLSLCLDQHSTAMTSFFCSLQSSNPRWWPESITPENDHPINTSVITLPGQQHVRHLLPPLTCQGPHCSHTCFFLTKWVPRLEGTQVLTSLAPTANPFNSNKHNPGGHRTP